MWMADMVLISSVHASQDALRNKPTRLDQGLRSDNYYQSYVHRPYHADRRRILSALISAADAHLDLSGDKSAPPARKLANKITGCCAQPTLYQDNDTGRLIVSQTRCKSRVCPRCATFRAHQVQGRIRKLVQHLDDPRFLTLTLVSSNAPLRSQVESLKQAFVRFRRSREYKKHVTGGVAIMEITYNAKACQWHPHLHCIIDGTYWAQRKISAVWQRSSNGSRVVDIRRIASRSALVHYVTKYVSKSSVCSAIPPERIAEWATNLHGLRVFQCFGKLHRAIDDALIEQAVATFESVLPYECLIEAGSEGDLRAKRLARIVEKLTKCRLPDGDETAANALLAHHCKAAQRVRTWWRHKQDVHRDNIARRPRNKSPINRLSDRAQWLWQESTDTALSQQYRC